MIRQASPAERDPIACGEVAGALIAEAIVMLEDGTAPIPVAFERDGENHPFKLVMLDDEVAAAGWCERTTGWDPGVVVVDAARAEIQLRIPGAVDLTLAFVLQRGRLTITDTRLVAGPGWDGWAGALRSGLAHGTDQHDDADRVRRAFAGAPS